MILGENDDPVEDLSSGLSELQELVSKIDDSCSAVAADDNLQAYIDDIDWEKDFLAQIGPTMSNVRREMKRRKKIPQLLSQN